MQNVTVNSGPPVGRGTVPSLAADAARHETPDAKVEATIPSIVSDPAKNETPVAEVHSDKAAIVWFPLCLLSHIMVRLLYIYIYFKYIYMRITAYMTIYSLATLTTEYSTICLYIY